MKQRLFSNGRFRGSVWRRLLGRKVERGSEQGNVALEFAFVLPIFLLILFGIIQFGYLFVVHNAMTNAAREGARMFAVQQVDSATAEAVTTDRLSGFGINFTVGSTMVTDPDGRDEVTITVSLPMAEVAFGDFIGTFTGRTLTTGVSMRRE